MLFSHGRPRRHTTTARVVVLNEAHEREHYSRICGWTPVRFGSLADKLSRAKIHLCPLLSESGHGAAHPKRCKRGRGSIPPFFTTCALRPLFVGLTHINACEVQTYNLYATWRPISTSVWPHYRCTPTSHAVFGVVRPCGLFISGPFHRIRSSARLSVRPATSQKTLAQNKSSESPMGGQLAGRGPGTPIKLSSIMRIAAGASRFFTLIHCRPANAGFIDEAQCGPPVRGAHECRVQVLLSEHSAQLWLATRNEPAVHGLPTSFRHCKPFCSS
jgi:hypothetical protein